MPFLAQLQAVYDLEGTRLYVSRFKSLWAEYGTLYRLAAADGRKRGRGGTLVTTMVQLVCDVFAPVHAHSWDMRGDRFEQRDRHQSIVRERLGRMAAMGLIRLQVDVDDEGWERRTVIYFLEPAAVDAEQLADARARMKRWRVRYGRSLNTQSRCQVRNANAHGRPLNAEERKRRGVEHAGAARAARIAAQAGGFDTDSAPPLGALSGASRPPGNSSFIRNRSDRRNVSDRSGVTRVEPRAHTRVSAALEPHAEFGKSSNEEKAFEGSEGQRPSEKASERLSEGAERLRRWQEDPQTLLAEMHARAAREAELRRPMAARAQDRALAVAGWPADGPWPRTELRNAWMVVRYGASTAVAWGPIAAGPLSDAHLEQLRRAVRRYELYRPRLPDGGRGTRWEDWPDRGIHALLHIGAQSAAGRLYAGPQLLFVAIERLDQASYRLRAAATAHDPARQERARRRAERRQTPPTPPAGGLAFRTSRTWPAWMLLAGASEPTFDANGRLLLDPELLELYAPAPHTDMWRRTVRDAYLLAHQDPPVELDSRRLMAARDRGDLPRTRPPQAVVDVELRELSHLTGMPIARLERLSVELRADWLQDQRRQAAERQAQETKAFRASMADIYPPSSS